MKRWVTAVIVALSCAGSALPVAAATSAIVRYRLTIEVSTPEGVRTGSGVIEVRYSKLLRLFGASAEWGAKVIGEAVAVDLGARGTLFALLKEGTDPRSAPENIVLRAFGFPHGAMPTPVEQGIAEIAALRGRVELPVESVPLLVRFRDPADPTTVERVDPRDAAASFGPGVRVRSASVEITDAPVSRGVKELLPDFGVRSGYSEWYRGLPYNSPQRIGPEHFYRGTRHGDRC